MERESPALLRMAEDGDTAAVVLDPFGEGTEMLVILLQSLRDQFSSLYMGLHSGIYDRWAKRFLCGPRLHQEPYECVSIG